MSAVQSQKRDIDVVEVGGFRRGQGGIEADDFVAAFAQGAGDGAPALEADFPLVRFSTAKNGNAPAFWLDKLDKVDRPHENAFSLSAALAVRGRWTPDGLDSGGLLPDFDF
jgi:hypothetical protein